MPERNFRKFDEMLVSEEVLLIVKHIEKINQLMGSAVYEGGIKPVQFENFQHLITTANEEELLDLTNYPNAAVRCYAFWALACHRSSFLTLAILEKYLKDTDWVSTQFGCLSITETVASFTHEAVTNGRYGCIDIAYLNINSNEIKRMADKTNEV